MIRQRRPPTTAVEWYLPLCDVLYNLTCVRVLHVRARKKMTVHHTPLLAFCATLSRGIKSAT